MARTNAVAVIDDINKSALKTDLPKLDIGDTLNVHCRIVEGETARIQLFQGGLIARSGRGINEMIIVRRIVDDMGVERYFPINSPRVAKYEVIRKADARRAKLYYLRDRVGKSRRLRDKRRGMEKAMGAETAKA